jgi:acyl transferase domain-containing protein/NADPH:quinone reductase-like Zn-dependent oxidoreductase/NAD(P)-dependent dehydrogenase (short-subunit alcohol dehydrogenase family)/acyl carrier protein
VKEIAIVGVGCRLPGGVASREEFWSLLREGREAIGEVPADRWDHDRFCSRDRERGKTQVRRAGFLEGDVYGFDAAFFGISPREAEALDPQQRLLLEITWEALEDGGIVPKALQGSRTGVFVGCFSLDHMVAQFSPLNERRIGPHAAKSSTLVMLSNRISYSLDLRGPSMTLDTACSSSMVAIHVACQSLLAGECSLALAGGVNLLLAPTPLVAMDQGSFLSPDGRCYAFDERANGYVRSEGAAMLALKPIADAKACGDPILGVICATGTNQDGRTPGITLPREESQRALIEETWSQVPALGSRLAYLEAHGTGTPAGDPIEARALGASLAALEGSRPCWLGSVKTNLGHLEGAAGVVGLLKAVLCLRHREVVPHLHFETPTLDFDALGLRIPRALKSLPSDGEPLYAAVNSFGYGGSNAHAVLRDEPCPTPASAGVEAGPYLLSARSPGALHELVSAHLHMWGERPGDRVLDTCHTLALRREHHRHRLALEGGTRAEVLEQLEHAQSGSAGIARASLSAEHVSGRPVFVYTGMGAQSWGMGQGLFEEPVFEAAVSRCDEIWRSLGESSLLSLLTDEASWSGAAGEAIRTPSLAQPLNFALQVALTEWWRSRGVVAEAIVGHSAGEFAAAWAAGSLCLEEVLRILAHRCKLQETRVGSGTMIAVGGPLPVIQRVVGETAGVAVAAVNGPGSLTLAGPQEALEDAAFALEDGDCRVSWLRVDVPYHHPSMACLESAFLDQVGEVSSRVPEVPLYSTVTGALVTGPQDGAYWWRNILEPARFAPAIEAARRDGRRHFLEVGPHPALGASIAEAFAAHKQPVSITHSLKRGQPGSSALRKRLGELFTKGVEVEWGACFEGGRHVELPAYPWQRVRLHQESEGLVRHFRRASEHPLLQSRALGPNTSWTSELRVDLVPFLPDHVVFGRVVFPAAGTVAAGLAAAQLTGRPLELRDLRMESMFAVEAGTRSSVRLDEESGRFTLHGTHSDDGTWTRHAQGTIAADPRGVRTAHVDLESIRARAQALDPEALYERATRFGLSYGPAFRVVRELYEARTPRGGEVLARLALSDGVDPAYPLHPALLDGAFQACLALTDDQMPVSLRDLRLHREASAEVWAWCKVERLGGGVTRADLVLCDEDGEVVCEAFGAETRAVTPPGSASDLVRLRWEAATQSEESPLANARWLVVHGPDDPIALAFQRANPNVVSIRGGDEGPALDLLDREALARQVERHSSGGFSGVLYLGVTEVAGSGPPGEEAVVGLLHLVQVLSELEFQRPARLSVLTRGAHRVQADDPPADPGARALWGLARVIRAELPELACRLTDVGTHVDPTLALREVCSTDDESETALRGERRLVLRALPGEQPSAPVLAEPGTPARLVQSSPGRLEGLVFEKTPRRTPSEGEVEVEVRVGAINFKDVLKALGRLPVDYLVQTAGGEDLGLEVAGVVARVGADVEGVLVGDEVTCLGVPLATWVTLDAKRTIPRAPDLPWEAAASLINYATAYHGLIELGRMRAGDRVLIHSAASGVGLAAIQLAERAKAHVFATAGTAKKREFLLSLGVAGTGDSRSLSFVPAVREWSEGKGVDLVLNPLTGEAMRSSLELLAPGGRFVEIGKADILSGGSLPLAPFGRNLSFHAFDFDTPSAGADLTRAARAANDLLAQGELRPLPTQAFEAHQVSQAFKTAATGEHMGKLVVHLDRGRLPCRPGAGAPIRADATYLVVGGLGDLGRSVAEWLVDQGARRLVLVARTNAESPSAKALQAELSQRGAVIDLRNADMSQEGDTRALLADLGGPPLRGVFHLATVYRDSLLTDQSARTVRDVFAAKAASAWWLHRHTRDLEHFVVFSSISALTGTPGQGNYAAANAFLEGLTEARRAEGLPATCLAWGPVQGTRIVEGQGALERAGFRSLSPARVLSVLGTSLRRQREFQLCVDLDWVRWGQLQHGQGLKRFERLGAVKRAQGAPDVSLQGLSAVDRPRRLELLESLMRDELGRILSMSPDEIDVEERLMDLGVDSLMMVELRAVVQERLHVDLRSANTTKRSLRSLAQLVEASLPSSEVSLA